MKLGKDNRGSSIVTVLIVVTFLTVLVTTLIYISGMNYRTKQVEYQNKQSFYVSETAIEEIKAKFALEASSALEKAYKATLVQYANENADDRDELYKNTFVQEILAQWEDKRVLAAYTNADIMKNSFGLTSESATCVVSVGNWVYDYDAGYAQLKDVIVSYTNAQGYTNMISTDFYIEAPDLDWSIDGSRTWSGSVDDSRQTFSAEDFVIFKNWKKY